MQSIVSFAGIISPLLGALVVKLYSIRPLWFISGVGYLACSLILLFFAEEKYKPKKVRLTKLFNNTLANIKQGVRFCRSHNRTRYLILASIFMAMMVINSDYWQPFLSSLNMPVYWLGIIYSVISAISMLVPFTARYLANYNIKDVFKILIMSRILLLLLVLLLYPGLFVYGALIFILTESIFSLRNPLLEPFYQKQLPKKIRATVTSVKSMGTQLGYGIGSLAIGYLADIIGVQNIIAFTGIFGLVAIYYFSKIR
jgi:predicted MFS family arabinose efflux permease